MGVLVLAYEYDEAVMGVGVEVLCLSMGCLTFSAWFSARILSKSGGCVGAGSRFLAQMSRRFQVRGAARPQAFPDSRFLVLAAGINAVAGVFFWVIASRFFSTTAVGQASTVVSVGTSVASLSLLSIGPVIERYFPVLSVQRRVRAALLSCVGVVLSAVLCSGVYVWVWDSSVVFPTLVSKCAFCCCVVVLALFALSDSVLNGWGVPRVMGWKNVSQGVLKAVVVGAVAALGLSSVVWAGWLLVWCWVGVSVLVLLAVVGVLVARVRIDAATNSSHVSAISHDSVLSPADDGIPVRSQAIRFHRTSIVWLLGQSIPGLFIPSMVVSQAGLEQAAFFNTAWLIVNASLMIMAIFTGPFVSKAVAPGAVVSALWPQMKVTTLRVSALRFVGVSVIGPLALYVYGAEYAQAAGWLLVLMGIAHVVGAPAFLFGVLSKVYSRIVFPACVQVCASVVLVLAVWWLLPHFGIVAVGVAYLIQDVGILLVAWIPLRRLVALSHAQSSSSVEV